jgi:hypothetical protein
LIWGRHTSLGCIGRTQRGSRSQEVFREATAGAYGNLPPSLIGLEACSGAHFLGGALREQGHEVRVIPAHFVKPYRKSNKNDIFDAEAVAEAETSKTCGLCRSRRSSSSMSKPLRKQDSSGSIVEGEARTVNRFLYDTFKWTNMFQVSRQISAGFLYYENSTTEIDFEQQGNHRTRCG